MAKENACDFVRVPSTEAGIIDQTLKKWNADGYSLIQANPYSDEFGGGYFLFFEREAPAEEKTVGVTFVR